MLALPIFTARHQATIVGVSELNFCVRDGNRWTLMTINTNYINASKRETLPEIISPLRLDVDYVVDRSEVEAQ